ncbi:hypothetical protein Tco_1272253 [Tanacetum coccineum]
MVPPNNLGPDLNGKAINETQYRGMIGSLMYLTASRPDIQFSTCLCARYQANPKESHLIAVKRIFRYLKGTPSLGLWYPKCLGFDLKGYSDSDYAGCNMDRKSTSGACQLLGGKLVCWSAKKQQSVAMSSAEAEYVAAAGCCANILWMKSQLTDYDIIYEKVPIFCDNTSAIAISNNPVLHSRTKHIDIRYHFIRDHILKGDIELHFIPTQYQLADIFTKPLDEPTFKRLIVELGGIIGEIGITTFRNAIGAHYSDTYVNSPSLAVVRPWFAEIGYNGEIRVKRTLKKSCLPPRERVIPYPRFISLLLEYMAPEYANESCTINPTQIFSIHNWALKPNQPEEPPFIEHMLAVCNLAAPNVPKAPKPSSIAERVPQGTKHGAKPGHKKQSTSSKQPFVYSREAIKCGSSRAPTGSKTDLSQKSKESSSTMDSNPSQPSVSTFVDTEMHKEDQQAAGDPSYLGATSEEGAHPQLSSGSNPSVLVDKTKSAGDGLKTAHTTSDTKSAFFTPHSPTDEPIIVLDESEEEEDVEKDKDTKDTLKEELEQAKAKAKAEAALLKAQPSFPNVEHLNELLVKSLKIEFSNILSAHDFSSSLPTELKNLPSKFNKLTEEVKELKNQVHNLEIELPGNLKEIPTKLEDFTKTVTSLTSQVAKLKTLHLLSHVIKALNKFAQVLDSASSKAGDQSVPSAGQANIILAEEEKNTNQATISQLFQRRAEKVNLNRPQPETITPPPILLVITTTTSQMQSPSFQPPPKSSSQPKGKHIKEDKGKKALSSEEAEKESTKSGSDDETKYMPSSMVKSSKKKELKKFNFVTESREHVHLTKEQISAQKEIEEEAKAKAARREGEIRKEELIDLLGLEVVNKYYNDKLQCDKYCDKMLNRRAASRITNCDVLTRKGPITLKVYREDGTSEIIPNFKASDLHLGEWREVMESCPKRTGK